MASFVKPIREKGIIVSKIYREAKEERSDLNGKVWPAREEEFILDVVSCDEDDFSPDFGILNGTRLEYKVSKTTFEQAKFLDWCNVKYTASQFGERLNLKAEDLKLL